MFALKKIVSELLFPHTIFLALLGIGVLMLWLSSRRRLAQGIVTIAAAGFFLLAYTGPWSFLVAQLEYKYPVFDSNRIELKGIQWVVVLGGGGITNESLPAPSQLSPQSLARLTEGLRVARSVPDARLLLSGNSDALIMRNVAQILGIEHGRIAIEDKARDTENEAVEIKRMVGADRIVLVTSAIHLPRAMALFNKQGMAPIPAPADFLVRQLPQQYSIWPGVFPSSGGATRADALIHEYLGLLWGKWTGRI